MNSIGAGPSPREDGLLPAMAFQHVFISRSGGCNFGTMGALDRANAIKGVP
jgi:hypothetical protein